MKQKSEHNIQAAKFLLNNKYYIASVHCSYYAVLQKMKYMLAHTKDRPISYDSQDEHTQSSSSHKYIITEIGNRISNPKEEKIVKEKFRDLQDKRNIADYKLIKLSDDDCVECKDNAMILIGKLESIFGNI